MANPVTTGGLVGKTKGLLTKGKNLVGAGVKNINLRQLVLWVS